MNYDFDECVSELIDKYWMLRESYIKEELENTIDDEFSEEGMDITNEAVLREFDERMEYNFNVCYLREIDFNKEVDWETVG